MKTIEERAKKSSIIAYGWYNRKRFPFEDGYIRGATEQKRIDTEKICEDILYGLMHDFGCDIPDVEKAKEYVKRRMEE